MDKPDILPSGEGKPLHLSLGDHLLELRRRLMWVFLAMISGMIVCWFFAEDIYGFLVTPLAEAMSASGGTNRLIYTNLTEAFFTYLRVSFFAGVFLTFPVLLVQIWKFVTPGLYQNERQAFFPYLVATPILFFIGGAIVYFVVIPMAWPFFLSFQTGAEATVLPVQLEARVSDYLDLVMTLIFAFGLCFQMPVILALLGRAGILTAASLSSFRKYAVILIFTVAAFITPPDVLSQFMLAVPLMALYEISILIVRHTEKKAS
jgi:sec-independent protein translocase protein TatC